MKATNSTPGVELVNGTAFWAVAALAPAAVVFLGFIVQPWSWGLMDDLQLLAVSGGLPERVSSIFSMYRGVGEFKWTHALHCGVFYTLFANHPWIFYIFKWSEVMVMLGCWGMAAWRLTARPVAFWLVVGITLSYHYIYDQFFFLSAHETTGLLFLGAGLWALVSGEAGDGLRWPGRLAAAMCFILALGAKETMLAPLAGLGAALLWPGLPRSSSRALRQAGAALIVLMACYGLWLKLAVSVGHTSSYSFTDLVRIRVSLGTWVSKSLSNHIPWLLLAGWIWQSSAGCPFWPDGRRRFGLSAGLLMYAMFLAVLLPWNTASYYASPLGLFFGFIMAVLLADRVTALSPRHTVVIAGVAGLMSLTVALYAHDRESVFQRDTQALEWWLAVDTDVEAAARAGQVWCDALEPSGALPGHSTRKYGVDVKAFRYRSDIMTALPKEARFLVHRTRKLPGRTEVPAHWRAVFTSRNWQVYRKDSP